MLTKRHHSSSPEDFASPNVSAPPDVSDNLEFIFESENFDFYADIKIAVGAGGGARGCGGVRFELKDLVRACVVGIDALMTVMAYLYSGKVKPLPRDVFARASTKSARNSDVNRRCTCPSPLS